MHGLKKYDRIMHLKIRRQVENKIIEQQYGFMEIGQLSVYFL
jgi:hypothetical protein